MDVHNEGEGLKDFVTTQFEPLNKKSMTEGLKNAQIWVTSLMDNPKTLPSGSKWTCRTGLPLDVKLGSDKITRQSVVTNEKLFSESETNIDFSDHSQFPLLLFWCHYYFIIKYGIS
jgi:hypothetical protein